MSGPSYHGFADRKVESVLYGVLQRRFLTAPKECDVGLADILEGVVPDGDGYTGCGRRLLDVGAGNGHTIRYLKERFEGFTWYGIDLREEAAQESGGLVDQADLFTYDPGKVDVIVCQSVTYSLTDDQFQDALSRFRSWLPPGGIVILFDQFTPWEQHLTITERSRLHPEGHPLTVRPYSQLREIATAAGLEVLEIRPFHYRGGQHWDDMHDLRSYNHGGLTMRGCFNQTQAHAVLVAV